MKHLLAISVILISYAGIFAQSKTYQIDTAIRYYSDSIVKKDNYIEEMCHLDIYYPKEVSNFPTIVWFHGGGLSGGNKELPQALKGKGIAIIGVSYRLHPKVSSPKYIEDAAAAVAWAFNNIKKYGGNRDLIFISGHSAGGYLASMIGMDKKYLAAHDIDANNIAGLIPFSGHTITHFTVRKERNIPGTQPIIDELAPLYHVRADAPPLILITGDREMELLGRYEENAYMMRMMKIAGHKATILHELDGYGHNMVAPAMPLLIRYVKSLTKEIIDNSSE